jgi:hypothetical protein
MPEDPGGEIADVTLTGKQEKDRKSPVLELTDYQRQTEHLLSAAICLEFVRIATPPNPSVTAAYANQVVGNSRLLSAGNPGAHMALLRHMVRWLRSVPVGSSELRW